MMNNVKRQGTIKCECSNEFYFQSIRKEIPCMKCGKMHPNNGEPVTEEPEEQTELENE